jgi:hypothetical protein
MAHSYLVFDFGADEEKVQQARHKLEGWKQAFRLDKKLQYKFDRSEPFAQAEKPEAAGDAESEKKPNKGAKSKSKAKAKSTDTGMQNGDVKLLVRLYFSNHEKLSEERWLKRIPAEEPFKGASPQLVQEGQPQFPEISTQFESLD